MNTKQLSVLLSFGLLVMLIVGGVLFNIRKPRIMVLHSYNTDYSWTRGVDRGLKSVLDKDLHVTVRWHYMDTKKHDDEKWLFRAGLIAKQAIDKWEPDVLIAVDNAAQKRAAMDYVNHPKINIVFAGINGPIEPYGYDTAENVTGILERRSLKSLCDIVLLIEKGKGNPGLVKRPVRLRYLMDSSGSVMGDRAYIDNFDWHPFIYTGSFAAKNYEEWQREVLESAGKTDYIFVTNYRKLPWSENDHEFVPPGEVMAWTEARSPVPVIGLQVFNVHDGGMLAVGTSPYEQGEVAGRLAVRIIEKGVEPKDLPVVPNKQFFVAMREAEILKRKVQLPDIYEAFSRATGNYVEKDNPAAAY